MKKGAKIGIGIGVGIAVIGIIVLVAKKASAASKVISQPIVDPKDNVPPPKQTGVPAPAPTGVTVAPHTVDGGKVSWTLNGVTATGKPIAPPPPPKGGLSASSDQMIYGVPYVSCVTFQ